MTTEQALLDQKRSESLIGDMQSISQLATPTHFSLEDLETRLELLEVYWAEYQERDYVLQRVSEKHKERSYFANNTFSKTQLAYLSVKSWFKARIREKSTPAPAPTPPTGLPVNVPASANSATQASLEKLSLPRFNGNQRDWEAFKEKFTSLVVNDSAMAPVIKIQRLANCLEGEAAEKLKGIHLLGDNFQTAWDTLVKRYDNKFLRFALQMQSLVNLPTATSERGKHLSQLLNSVNESINTFTSLERPVAHWDDILIYFIESKLATSTRYDWIKEVEKKKGVDFPKYSEMKLFLEDRIRSLDLVENDHGSADLAESEHTSQRSGGHQRSAKTERFSKKGRTGAHHAARAPNEKDVQCSYCKSAHFIGYCQRFRECSPIQRRAHVAAAKLCFNCLNAHHMADACESKGRCLVCGAKHHTRLHQDVQVSNANTSTCEKFSEQTTAAHAISERTDAFRVSSSSGTLLSTACVLLQAPNGQQITVRALLDSGAEESFITEHVVQALSLHRKSVNVVVSGVGGSNTATANSRVTVHLKSSQQSDFCFEFSALVLRKLSSIIPRAEIKTLQWSHLENLSLADPHFGTPGRIDCILSSQVYAAVIRPGIKRGPSPDVPVALQTVFGWVLMGSAGAVPAGTSSAACHIAVAHDLTTLVSRFWEIEEAPSHTILSPTDQECYDHFRRTHSRNDEGRFVVRLPFLRAPQLSGTREIAEACLCRLERRFLRQPQLAESYRKFMHEYSELRHMDVVPDDQVNAAHSSYIPHHGVFKAGDSSKLRVVFNASQKNATGISLNSLLHVGPKLQEDVIGTMVRWSFLRYAFTCDVVKMFRQFLVHHDDCDWQRILWRDSADVPVRTYRLCTVTYGTACAPFLANACMLQLADDGENEFPLAAEVLRRGRYVDDFFAGGDTIQEAVILRDQLVSILRTAGMSVGKWAATQRGLLADLRDDREEFEGPVIQDQEIVSTLGIRWLSSEDAFCFRISLPDPSDKITKRSMLSEIARLYDPLGWSAPVIIIAKLMLQSLWLSGVDWDDRVPAALASSWRKFNSELAGFESIRVPRWLGTFRSSKCTLHGFSDASERAYAAAIYIAVPTETGFSTRLLIAKSKVAPIKVVSLPKLELCGAHLLAQLIEYILTVIPTSPEIIHCWSDSKVVLAWLRSHPSRWKSYVANRVSAIISALPNAIWRHVRSADNPADLATRGVSPGQLQSSSLWWSGPDWLQSSSSAWPESTSSGFETNSEARRSDGIYMFSTQTDASFQEWCARFSSVDRVMRILAYIARWRANAALPAQERSLSWLCARELSRGRVFLLRLVQQESFGSELQALRTGKSVSNASAIRRLSPFIDQDGLLRVGGRLQNSYLSENEKHPVILPGKHHISRLFIEKAHTATLHGGPTLVQSFILRQYWILRGRNLIRGVVRRCVQCARHRATTLEQQMGPLPAIRTRPARPFSITGVDFAGPFMIRCSPGRGQKSYKGYVAVFVCMVVRAVHLEVVSDLTSAAFLAAFRRFVARRGLCSIIYSDNGTNFRGADAELHRLFTETSAMGQEVASSIAKDGVKWSYIPPRAPSFGGLWEANVKSFKHHLRRVVGDSKLTFEEFSTVACSIEACLNSRPLSRLSADEEDVAALTPGHFLIGASMLSPAEPFEDTTETRSAVNRWHLLSLMRNHFWKRWQQEFLSQAQERSKWIKENHTFGIGDVVLFKDELTPPTKWPLARITHLHKGKDGLSRVAVIKTAHAEYTRPVHKLILLPVNEIAVSHLAIVRELMAGGDAVE